MALFQGTLACSLWQVYRKTQNPMGLIFWIATFSDAFFSNYLENPFGAVPFYLIAGMSMAPIWCLDKRGFTENPL